MDSMDSQSSKETKSSYRVIVYGGDLPAVFAAAKASADLGATASDRKVLLIVPYPESRCRGADGVWRTECLLGGIMTAGGLNYWDDKEDASGELYVKGSYYFFKRHMGHGFNRVELSDYCKYTMKHRCVDVLYSADIYNYSYKDAPRRISSVLVRPITRDAEGRIVWQEDAAPTRYTADIFIDASTDGRLARKGSSAFTVGRYDWPAELLPEDELAAANSVGRQQAATLLVKMRLPEPPGFQVVCYPGTQTPAAHWSSIPEYQQPGGLIYEFNEKYKDTEHIMIKPNNAARDGQSSDEWWVNGLLVFNVDGRAHDRDAAEKTVFRVTPKYGFRTTDEAWMQARSFVREHREEIQDAFRTFPGFSGCEIVQDENGEPVVGDVLYVRETVHLAKLSSARAHGSESNYQVTTDEAQKSGKSPVSGSDTGNYAHRIGVGKYGCDLHPFQPSDLISDRGDYLWGLASAQKMRADAVRPENPVYIPYETMLVSRTANLLIAGYAASISSYAWGELRVFSNLSVLGDAAGLAAAYCCLNGVYPGDVAKSPVHIRALQKRITDYKGRLEK